MPFFSDDGDMCASIVKSQSILLATHSRHNEEEADLLGIQVAAEACFDTEKGTRAFAKIADLEHHERHGWHSTHPTSDDR